MFNFSPCSVCRSAVTDLSWTSTSATAGKDSTTRAESPSAALEVSVALLRFYSAIMCHDGACRMISLETQQNKVFSYCQLEQSGSEHFVDEVTVDTFSKLISLDGQ